MLPAALIPYSHQHLFSKGYVLFVHGDAATQLWSVEKGWVKLFRTTPDGKESTLGLCTKDDIFGEAALLPDTIYLYSAEVVSADAVLTNVSQTTIQQEIVQKPALAQTFMPIMHALLAKQQQFMDQLQSLTAQGRLGCFLLRLCDKIDFPQIKNIQLTLPLDKHVLASALAMKPETFSRALLHLRAFGVHTYGETLVLESVEKLRQYVCSTCTASGLCDVEGKAIRDS
jgi:CRP-like cAMP-binding protein